MFSQLLQLFPRPEFQHVVKKTRAERHARGFSCWGQFVSMLFCHLGRAHSLREITGGLRSCEGNLKHLGITAPTAPPWPTPTNTAPGPSWEVWTMARLKKPTQISFMLDEEHLKALKAISETTMIPLSALVRKGVELVIERCRRGIDIFRFLGLKWVEILPGIYKASTKTKRG